MYKYICSVNTSEDFSDTTNADTCVRDWIAASCVIDSSGD